MTRDEVIRWEFGRGRSVFLLSIMFGAAVVKQALALRASSGTSAAVPAGRANQVRLPPEDVGRKARLKQGKADTPAPTPSAPSAAANGNAAGTKAPQHAPCPGRRSVRAAAGEKKRSPAVSPSDAQLVENWLAKHTITKCPPCGAGYRLPHAEPLEWQKLAVARRRAAARASHIARANAQLSLGGAPC